MKKLLLVFLCFFSYLLNAQSVDSLIPQNYPQVIKSESTGWNSSDFEPYLKKYTITCCAFRNKNKKDCSIE